MNEDHMAVPKHPHLILEAIEGQAHTYRYSTVPTLQPRQSVAAHIGRCAQIMVVVCREAHISKRFTHDLAAHLMTEITIHDLGESLTGDIIWPTKNHVPEIEEYELRITDQLMQLSLYTGPPICQDDAELITQTVKMVDLAEGAMYSAEEVKLGNHRFMNPLNNYKNGLYNTMRVVEQAWGLAFGSIRMIHRRAEQIHARRLQDF